MVDRGRRPVARVAPERVKRYDAAGLFQETDHGQGWVQAQRRVERPLQGRQEVQVNRNAVIREHLNRLGPELVSRALARAAMGDFEAQKALLAFVMPRAKGHDIPISNKVRIDLSSQEGAKKSITEIAQAIGDQALGLEEGIMLMDAVGRALERISVVDITTLTDRMEELERAPAQGAHGASTRAALSRANGSTPRWGKIEHHPSLSKAED